MESEEIKKEETGNEEIEKEMEQEVEKVIENEEVKEQVEEVEMDEKAMEAVKEKVVETVEKIEKKVEEVKKKVAKIEKVRANSKRPSEQERIEADNLLEEASEIFEGCIKCGMCKSLCPVFKALREESVSPRGHAILLSDKILDKVIFECNLCRACERKCPLNIKVCEAVLKAREAAVLKGKGLKENEEMIENIRKSGNPFGEGEVKDLDKLYCC